jgi:superfamily II DNA or RNA helicase
MTRVNDLIAQPTPAKPKDLRPHQIEALRLIKLSAGQGNRRIVCQMPTGAGKTVTAAKLIASAKAKGNRSIFTVPALSLINQTVAAFEAEGVEGIGVMQANHPRTNPMARVQVASVQTLAKRDIPDAAVVIVDECHIRAAVVEKLMDERPDVFFIGLSATPWADGMGERWQDLVIPVTIGDLIETGMLSKFTAFAPDVPDLRGVKIKAGEYAEAGLERVMGDAKLVGSVTQTWLEKGGNRPTLCFGVNRAHAGAMAAEFAKHGVASAYVDAFTDMAERSFINDQFRRGEVKVICSVRTMTTGVDLPVSCIIDAAPTRSEILHVQKIGRGLRVNPGTEDCLILDHAGNSIRLGLVTDIFHDTLSMKDRAEKGEAKPDEEKLPKPCPECGVLYTGMTCPECGHERKPSARVATQEGELVEIAGGQARASMADKQAFWSMALWLDQERGRGGKLAKGMFKGKFGVWPNRLHDTPMPPDRAFVNYDKSRRIAYAKAMAKRDEAA